jgi:hypothetical protein
VQCKRNRHDCRTRMKLSFWDCSAYFRSTYALKRPLRLNITNSCGWAWHTFCGEICCELFGTFPVRTNKGTRISGAPFFQLAVRYSGRARRSAGAGAACTDSAGAHGPLRRRGVGRRGADRAAGILRRRSASIRLVLITNHIATHVPALVGSRASRSRACSGSLCICYPGDCQERSASNRSKIDFVHGVSSLVDRQECRQISMRPFKPRSVKFSNRTFGRGNSGQNNPRHLQVRSSADCVAVPISAHGAHYPNGLSFPQFHPIWK